MSDSALSPLSTQAEKSLAAATQSVLREALERMTGWRWLLNEEVPVGKTIHHDAGYSDPDKGLDTSIETYVINPADLLKITEKAAAGLLNKESLES